MITPFHFTFFLLHICALQSYNSCQVLQLVDYWRGKGQSSSLECADTHKLFNFHLQRSVVRKYWTGQRWEKHEMKRQAGKAAYFTIGLCVCATAVLLTYYTKSKSLIFENTQVWAEESISIRRSLYWPETLSHSIQYNGGNI